jgi:hypothetical protein
MEHVPAHNGRPSPVISPYRPVQPFMSEPMSSHQLNDPNNVSYQLGKENIHLQQEKVSLGLARILNIDWDAIIRLYWGTIIG